MNDERIGSICKQWKTQAIVSTRQQAGMRLPEQPGLGPDRAEKPVVALVKSSQEGDGLAKTAPDRNRFHPVPLLRLLGVLVTLAAAPVARAGSVTIEAFGGWQHLQLSRQALGNAIGGSEGTGLFGADLLGNLGGFGLGLALDKTVSGSAQPWAGSVVAGFLPELAGIRLELLGEIGRRARDFGDLFGSPGETFLGLRPGVSVRLAASPLRFGVTGLVRWPTSNGDVGSPDYGFIGRVGFEVP